MGGSILTFIEEENDVGAQPTRGLSICVSSFQSESCFGTKHVDL